MQKIESKLVDLYVVVSGLVYFERRRSLTSAAVAADKPSAVAASSWISNGEYFLVDRCLQSARTTAGTEFVTIPWESNRIESFYIWQKYELSINFMCILCFIKEIKRSRIDTIDR